MYQTLTCDFCLITVELFYCCTF